MADLNARISRLEAQVAHILKHVPAETSDDSDSCIMTPAGKLVLQAMVDLNANEVAKFVAACNAYPDLAYIASGVTKAFENQKEFINAVGVSKVAPPQEIVAFLKPSADVIAEASKTNFKSKQYTHQQAWEACVGILSWPVCVPHAEHMNGMAEAAGFYLNRILTQSKDAEEPQKSQDREFVTTLRALLQKLTDIVKTHYKTGLEWNNIKGGKLSEYVSGGNSSAPAAAAAATPEPAKPAATTAAAKPSGGMSSLFGELNKGAAITSGLRTVTDDMKSKNMKDAPPAQPVASSSAAPKKFGAFKPAAVKKTPVLEEKNGSWIVEHHEDNRDIVLNDLDIKTSVYIGNVRNSNIVITGKPKSVFIDKAIRSTVTLPDVLSVIEIVNSDRATIFLKGVSPTIAIDKSKDCAINLSDVARASDPGFVTSNISGCNIQVTDPEEEEGIIEIALPEQYTHRILANNKVTAEPVVHG